MVNRRNLLKGSMLTLASCATSTAGAQSGHVESRNYSPEFVSVLPGIWKTPIGTPETYTHVSSRAVQPDASGIQRLPAVAMPPIDSHAGTVGPRGCLLTLPLAPHEEIFGFGLQ